MSSKTSRIKLSASQVVDCWELVKFVTTKVDEVDEKDLQPYLNELLHALLNEKAQCFVEMDEARQVIGVCITRLMPNKITGEKYLFIQNAYAFDVADADKRLRFFEFMKQFAQKEKCAYMLFHSRNKRLWGLGKMAGFKEDFRTFSFRLEN